MGDFANETVIPEARGKHAIAAPERFPCGKRKPIKGDDVRRSLEKMDDEMRLAETAQVAGQPHRQGSRSDMAESELGRFILAELAAEKEDERRPVYDAAINYFQLVFWWRRYKGIPLPHRIEFERSAEPCTEKQLEARVRADTEKIAACELAMRCVRMTGFISTRDLILDDVAPHPAFRGLVRTALLKLREKF
jgi:hypothetical protein